MEVFATLAAASRHADLERSARAGSVEWHAADEAAVASLADTRAPQGVVAVCRHLDVALGQVAWSRARLVAVCANVRDPGNAGAVIRCADAAGADVVVFAGTSVDPYNGKAVRASAGSLFHQSLVLGASVEETVATLREHHLVVLAADGGGDRSLDELDRTLLRAPTGWLFGNEAWGLPAEVGALADHVVRVPIYGRAESLNLATAAAICLYASAREQRHGADDCR